MILEDDPAEKWLNEYGLRKWQNKKLWNIMAERAYHWKDRVIIIDVATGSRRYVNEISFTEFIKDLSDWDEITLDLSERLI